LLENVYDDYDDDDDDDVDYDRVVNVVVVVAVVVHSAFVVIVVEGHFRLRHTLFSEHGSKLIFSWLPGGS